MSFIGKLWNKVVGPAEISGLGNVPPACLRFLNQHGSETITSLKVCRAPISQYLDTAMDLISGGGYSEGKKESNIDKFVHSSIIVNDKYRFEKNQVAKFFDYTPGPNEEYLNVSATGKTILNFIKDGMTAFPSANDFWRNYSALNHNCQWWLSNLLRGNGLLTPEVSKFFFQNLETLNEKVGESTNVAADTVTDLASTIDEGIQSLTGGRLSLKHGGHIRPRKGFLMGY